MVKQLEVEVWNELASQEAINSLPGLSARNGIEVSLPISNSVLLIPRDAVCVSIGMDAYLGKEG